jgi:hypothetical protein
MVCCLAHGAHYIDFDIMCGIHAAMYAALRLVLKTIIWCVEAADAPGGTQQYPDRTAA